MSTTTKISCLVIVILTVNYKNLTKVWVSPSSESTKPSTVSPPDSPKSAESIKVWSAEPHVMKKAVTVTEAEAEAEVPVVVKKKKRWAVMMIGAPRIYSLARQSFIQNVLNQTDPPMDVFTSTESSLVNSSCPIEVHSLELLKRDSTTMHFHQAKGTVKGHARGDAGTSEEQLRKTKDRFLNEQNSLLTLMEDYAKHRGITYDYIFYTRPDLYYTTPFNISTIERAIDENGSTVFSPKCCSFAGWCDRLAAASYQSFSKMIQSTEAWMRSEVVNNLRYETAFQKRAENVNLTKFDLTKRKDYGFYTLRFYHAKYKCEGGQDPTWKGTSWTDMNCNDCLLDLDITPDSCSLLNNSNSCSFW